MALKLTSAVFEDGGVIPEKYSCEGEDINPPLNIKDIPENTKTLALIMDDPDAPMGTFVHWVVWDIEPTDEIKEDSIPGKEGINNFGRNHYGGPCPPSGEHRYFFKLYALDTELNLVSETTKEDLKRAMEKHIIEQATLMGKFSR
ncbi:MAG: YbhB/YbcL family Raf kinase inhibitor-like protein [Nanobdellota archaeon]